MNQLFGFKVKLFENSCPKIQLKDFNKSELDRAENIHQHMENIKKTDFLSSVIDARHC